MMWVEFLFRDQGMRPIFIIGFSGVGKTTIGHRLANALELDFIDTDTFLQARYHSTITQMFAACGIEKFRKRERAALIELVHRQDTVISTGGGLVTHEDNLDLLLRSGTVLYLSASPEVLAERLYLVRETRPLVAGKTREELSAYVRDTLPAREQYYTRAHHTINADKMITPEDEQAIVREIIRILSH